MFLTIGATARFLGVSISTLRRLEKSKLTIAYARVSSHDQKEDLKRQIIRLEKFLKGATKNYLLIDDLGSGMNYKKKGLSKLLKLTLSGRVSKIVLTHKDRLLRFGSELIFKICNYFGVEVEIIEENKSLTVFIE